MKQFSLEEYLANPSRKVVTRDGRKVRIICTDAKQPNPIIALVELPNHYESVILYSKTGELWTNGTSNPHDLFFATEKHEGYINIYKNEREHYFGKFIYPKKTDAEAVADSTCIATAKIEWEE